MSPALDYALDVATDDVAEALRWLVSEGFDVVDERGGRTESFGNVLVDMRRGSSAIRVVRDRSQWFCDVETAGWTGGKPLHVLMTAIRGDVPSAESRLGDGGMWDQLPPGVSWSQLLPQVLAWGASGSRETEVANADAEWREAMARYLGQ